MKKKTMTPQHQDWQEFCRRLQGPEGCNFKEDTVKGFTWTCAGGTDQTLARQILNTMPEIDVEQSLIFFSQNGGHCDCEILFNVEHRQEYLAK